jgi:MFS family permease
MTPLDAKSAQRRFLVLTGMRWLPVGFMVPVLVLLMVDRGLSLAEVGLAAAAQGVLIVVLELPTGGLADAIGRKPVLLAATAFEVASIAVLFVADALWMFVIVFALQGVYRALDSGPLEAWYVDAALAADPAADFERGLSGSGVVLGVAVGAGALASGGIVAIDPFSAIDALAVPVLVAIALRLVEIVGIAGLVHEQRPALGLAGLRSSVRLVPSVIGGSVRLVKGSVVLLCLVSVELFWGFGMVTFEFLLPPKLAEVIGDVDRAAAILGPASAAAWLASAGGAALIPFATRRLGSATTAAALRILQGAMVVVMALFAGVVGVLAMYLATYAVHGASNPVHKALLHRQVTSEHRTTVLSVNSMMAMPAGALGAIVLGYLADSTSVSTAMVVGGVVLALAAPLYLPARSAERRERAAALASP